MMFGCSSLAEVRDSRWKRSTNSLSKASENGRTLMATSPPGRDRRTGRTYWHRRFECRSGSNTSVLQTPRQSGKHRGGRDEVSTTALARDDREALVPRERDAAGGVADAHTQDVLAARDVAQLQPPVYPRDRPIARGIEPEHHGRAPTATEQASDGAEDRATALSL